MGTVWTGHARSFGTARNFETEPDARAAQKDLAWQNVAAVDTSRLAELHTASSAAAHLGARGEGRSACCASRGAVLPCMGCRNQRARLPKTLAASMQRVGA
jgi:hypothetical protein